MPIKYSSPAREYGLALLGQQQQQGPNQAGFLGGLERALTPIMAALLMNRGEEQQEAKAAEYKGDMTQFQSNIGRALETTPTLNVSPPVSMAETLMAGDGPVRPNFDYGGKMESAGPDEMAKLYGNALLGLKSPEAVADLQPVVAQRQGQLYDQASRERMHRDQMAEQRRQYDVASVDQAAADVDTYTQRSLARGDRANEAINTREFQRQQTQDQQEFQARENQLTRQNAQTVAGINNPTGLGAGPFRGNGLDAQAMNILLDPSADTSSPTYNAAYSHLASPKMQFDQQTGQMIPITPDMAAYRKPGAGGQPRPQQQGAGRVPFANAAPYSAPQSAQPQAQPGTPTVGAPIQAASPRVTEGQSNAAGFADRATASHDIISKLETQGTSRTGKTLEAVPFGAGNWLQSGEYQDFSQARRDFVNAQLRRESGAVISDAEFANADQQYFPQPGDGPSVIEQKRKNRDRAVNALKRSAGPSYKPTSSNGWTVEREE